MSREPEITESLPGARRVVPRLPRVALLVESSNEYGRGLQRGVASYMRTHGGWSIELPEMGRGGPVPDWLASWNGDGILARIENAEIAEAVRATGIPAVDVSAARLLPTLPWVEVDESAVARLAVDHLLGRGFEHLAYCGDERFTWSYLRGAAFSREARARGVDVEMLNAPGSRDRASTLARGLVRLPRPLGLFACFDHLGRELLDACRHAGLLVPEEVAVLGADGDELLCGLADPPLSSIELDAHGAGLVAAELLARRMAGEDVGSGGHFVAPLRLVQRRSTDVLAIDDPILARALHYIHHHACEGIRVTDVLRAVAVSRRSLESRFRERLGRTPREAIAQVRVERIQALLRDTDLTIAQIAARTGFEHVEYLTVAFKRTTGCTPTAYRERTR